MASRQKNTEEKLKQDREESQLKLELMENLLKSETRKREEQLERLVVETERNIRQVQVKVQRNEKQSEEFFDRANQFFEKNVTKVANEVETFKRHILEESQKISGLVTEEIQSRFSSDK